MTVAAIVLMIGLPLALWLAYFVYKRKVKVKKQWYKSVETYLISFCSSGWITAVLSAKEWFQQIGFLDASYIFLMTRVKEYINLILPIPIPVELKIFIIILVIIFLTLLP